MERQIKVALFTYPSAFQNIGGGEILLLKTKEYLQREGVAVKLFDMWHDALEDFDILHVVSSVKFCLGLIQTAKNKGIKVVITPVFFSTFQRAWYEYGGLKRKVGACLRHSAKVLFPYFPSGRRKMLLLADALIPNSQSETDQLARLFAIEKTKMHVIPNCVDRSFEHADATQFTTRYQLRDFILSVGRIEPRKNQLNLIKAVKNLKTPLVIVGDPVYGYQDYYRRCKSEASGNVVFIERIPHQDPLLKAAYAACRCFVSQGWFETPGLAALEAGLAGANIATTYGGCTREYFKGLVEYFNPADPQDIRRAVEGAINKEKNSLLKEHIRENFLWEVAARKNIEVYRRLLNA